MFIFLSHIGINVTYRLKRPMSGLFTTRSMYVIKEYFVEDTHTIVCKENEPTKVLHFSHSGYWFQLVNNIKVTRFQSFNANIFIAQCMLLSVARFKFWNQLTGSKKPAKLPQNRLNFFSVKISPKKPKFNWISIFLVVVKILSFIFILVLKCKHCKKFNFDSACDLFFFVEDKEAINFLFEKLA